MKHKWAIRLPLTLSESTEKFCPEFSYKDLLKQYSLHRLGKQSLGDVLNGPVRDKDDPYASDEDEALRALARQLEQKYGSSQDKKKKRKRKKESDFKQLGEGYDETDPFIDNSDAIDDVLPTNVETKHGGFYINLGCLNFEEVPISEEEKSNSEDVLLQKVTKKNVIQSSDEEANEVCEEKKNSTLGNGLIPPKKRKLDEGEMLRQRKKMIDKFNAKKHKSSDEHIKTVEQPTATNGTSIAASIEAVVSKARENAENISDNAVQEDKKEEVIAPRESEAKAVLVNGREVESGEATISDKVSLVAPYSSSSTENSSDNESECGRRVDGNAVSYKQSKAEESLAVGDHRDESSSSADEDAHLSKTTEKDQVRPLPDGLPLNLIAVIDKIKEEGKTFDKMKEEGKTAKMSSQKFFSESVNKLLLSIEIKLCKCGKNKRNLVFSHLSQHLPYSAQTLMKRGKNLLQEKLNERLKKPIERLKDAVAKAMEPLLKAYEVECQSTNLRIEKSSTGEDEKEAELKKKLKLPKKVFQFSNEIRLLLCDVVKIRCQGWHMIKKRAELPVSHIKAFIADHIKPLWPKGWITTKKLFKESREGHSFLTSKAVSKRNNSINSVEECVSTHNLLATRGSSSERTLPIVHKKVKQEQRSDLDADTSNLSQSTSISSNIVLDNVAGQLLLKVDKLENDSIPKNNKETNSASGEELLKGSAMQVTFEKNSLNDKRKETDHQLHQLKKSVPILAKSPKDPNSSMLSQSPILSESPQSFHGFEPMQKLSREHPPKAKQHLNFDGALFREGRPPKPSLTATAIPKTIKFTNNTTTASHSSSSPFTPNSAEKAKSQMNVKKCVISDSSFNDALPKIGNQTLHDTQQVNAPLIKAIRSDSLSKLKNKATADNMNNVDAPVNNSLSKLKDKPILDDVKKNINSVVNDSLSKLKSKPIPDNIKNSVSSTVNDSCSNVKNKMIPNIVKKNISSNSVLSESLASKSKNKSQPGDDVRVIDISSDEEYSSLKRVPLDFRSNKNDQVRSILSKPPEIQVNDLLRTSADNVPSNKLTLEPKRNKLEKEMDHVMNELLQISKKNVKVSDNGKSTAHPILVSHSSSSVHPTLTSHSSSAVHPVVPHSSSTVHPAVPYSSSAVHPGLVAHSFSAVHAGLTSHSNSVVHPGLVSQSGSAVQSGLVSHCSSAVHSSFAPHSSSAAHTGVHHSSSAVPTGVVNRSSSFAVPGLKSHSNSAVHSSTHQISQTVNQSSIRSPAPSKTYDNPLSSSPTFRCNPQVAHINHQKQVAAATSSFPHLSPENLQTNSLSVSHILSKPRNSSPTDVSQKIHANQKDVSSRNFGTASSQYCKNLSVSRSSLHSSESIRSATSAFNSPSQMKYMANSLSLKNQGPSLLSPPILHKSSSLNQLNKLPSSSSQQTFHNSRSSIHHLDGKLQTTVSNQQYISLARSSTDSTYVPSTKSSSPSKVTSSHTTPIVEERISSGNNLSYPKCEPELINSSILSRPGLCSAQFNQNVALSSTHQSVRTPIASSNLSIHDSSNSLSRSSNRPPSHNIDGLLYNKQTIPSAKAFSAPSSLPQKHKTTWSDEAALLAAFDTSRSNLTSTKTVYSNFPPRSKFIEGNSNKEALVNLCLMEGGKESNVPTNAARSGSDISQSITIENSQRSTGAVEEKQRPRYDSYAMIENSLPSKVSSEYWKRVNHTSHSSISNRLPPPMSTSTPTIPSSVGYIRKFHY